MLMGGAAFGSRCDGADRRAGCPKGAFPSSTAAASPPWPDHHGETSRCVLPCKQRSGARLATMPACAVRIPIINMQSCVPMCSDAVLLRPALGFSCSSVARLGGVSERPCTLLKRVSRPGVPGCAERRSGRREGACPTQPAHTTSSRGSSYRRPMAGWRRAEWRDPRCVRPSIMYRGRGVCRGAVI